MPTTPRRLFRWLFLFLLPAQLSAAELPAPLARLLAEDHALPRYHEAWYHPVGRNPVLDAVLGDPLYLPAYGRSVSSALRTAAGHGSVERVAVAALRGGAVPVKRADFRAWLREADLERAALPGLDDALGALDARSITRAWQLFLLARAIAVEQFDRLTPEERELLASDPESYLFGAEPDGEYDYFTCDTTRHEQAFRLAARLDLAELARARRCLAFAADLLRSQALNLDGFDGRFEWTAPDSLPWGGVRAVIGGRGDDLYDTDVDFLIDAGGDDVYRNNAGGTGGRLPAAFLLDLAGRDLYEGTFAVQGAGVLGVGALIDAAGDDVYQATTYCQGAAWVGGGLLADLDGRDEYRADLFAQSAAAYGSALLWDAAGDDTYEAAGFAQAATTTLGTAFLVESGGDDRYRCGGRSDTFWTRRMGIGQGGAVGLRDYPWKNRPTFHGGVAFLDDAGGDDDFYCPAFCQGGGYVFGVGVLVNSGGDDRYVNGSEGLGAVVHLAAGLFIKEGGDDIYDGAWGSAGVGGDRGVGIFIDTAGNDRHRGGVHNLGTARKPKALGLFIDLAGDDVYRCSGESLGRVQRPRNPEEWPRALFLDLGGRDLYPADAALQRGDGLAWSFAGFGAGLDTTLTATDPAAALFARLPSAPRVGFPFDPVAGWDDNVSHRPLFSPPDSAARADAAALEAVRVARAERDLDLLSSPVLPDYDARRRLYERIDLDRFAAAAPPPLPDQLLANLSLAPEDLVAWTALHAALDTLATLPRIVGRDILDERFASAYGRRLLIRAVGAAAGAAGGDAVDIYDFDYDATAPDAAEVLRNRLAYDPDPLCRGEAALALGSVGGGENLAALRGASIDSSAVVRHAICRGLRESADAGAAAIAQSHFDDENLFVRRQAFLTAVSVGDKSAIDKLLASLEIASLDTGENYGHNLFAALARYVGQSIYEENGVDLAQWKLWWKDAKRNFDLPAAIAAETARRQMEASAHEND